MGAGHGLRSPPVHPAERDRNVQAPSLTSNVQNTRYPQRMRLPLITTAGTGGKPRRQTVEERGGKRYFLWDENGWRRDYDLLTRHNRPSRSRS